MLLDFECFFDDLRKCAFELIDGVLFAAVFANYDSVFVNIFVVANEGFAIFVRAEVTISFRKELRGNVQGVVLERNVCKVSSL